MSSSKYTIPFNIPSFCGYEMEYIQDAIQERKLSGDGKYTKLCNELLEEMTGASKSLLTPSCTQALEMSALLCNIQPGDEIIMSSYTFVSTANAFVLRGAKIIFVDIRPDTLNIDEKLIEAAITIKTKAIVVTHYAGVSCEMDTIMKIASHHNLYVIEDAAQAILCKYKGKMLGSIADFGCYSFHETKNINMGEGGALLIKNPSFIEDAEIIREKGTNRTKFCKGMVNKYVWIKEGSSYLPSELNAAYLYGELKHANKIIEKRLFLWNTYNDKFKSLATLYEIDLPSIPADCIHNGHIYYIKLKDNATREALLDYLASKGILAVSHYVPLHSSPGGIKYGKFHGTDTYTTRESLRICRLPLYYDLTVSQINIIVQHVEDFLKKYK